MEKTWNNKAWFLVLPVLVLVAFSAVLPLMTVVNYAFNDTFGQNEFFWAGIDWFDDQITSDRLHEALGRLGRFLDGYRRRGGKPAASLAG